MPEDELGYESRAADRLMFFSDAVVAIAITLLAIDFPVPRGGTVPEFWSSVRDNAGHYAAFLISFVVIAAAWSDHHDLFRYVGFGLSIPVFFATTHAWLLWIIIPVLLGRLRRHDHRDRGPDLT